MTGVMRRTTAEARAGRVSHGPLLVVLAVLAVVSVFQLMAVRGESPVSLEIAVLLSLVILLIANRDEDGDAVALAWALRLLVSFVVYRVLFAAAAFQGDWITYDQRGWDAAVAIRSGQALPAFGLGGGADNVWVLVGYVYAVTGRSISAIVVLESACGLAASWLYLGACRLLVPRPPRFVRYGMLFFPSFVFWTGLLGKDPLIGLALALSVYGAVAVCAGRGRALVNVGMMVAGVCLCLLFRPHLVLILVPALLAAMLFALRWGPGRSPIGQTERRASGRGLQAAAALVIGLAMLQTILSFGMRALGVEKPGLDALVARASQERTSLSVSGTGGSNTGLTGYKSPMDVLLKLPQSLGTLFFRPFPWDAHNATSAVGAADTLLFIGLCVSVFRGVVRNWRSAWRSDAKPALGFLLVWLAVWILMFLNMTANLGTMVRHRVQIIPVLLTLVAVVAARAEFRPKDGTQELQGERHV